MYDQRTHTTVGVCLTLCVVVIVFVAVVGVFVVVVVVFVVVAVLRFLWVLAYVAGKVCLEFSNVCLLRAPPPPEP